MWADWALGLSFAWLLGWCQALKTSQCQELLDQMRTPPLAAVNVQMMLHQAGKQKKLTEPTKNPSDKTIRKKKRPSDRLLAAGAKLCSCWPRWVHGPCALTRPQCLVPLGAGEMPCCWWRPWKGGSWNLCLGWKWKWLGYAGTWCDLLNRISRSWDKRLPWPCEYCCWVTSCSISNNQ